MHYLSAIQFLAGVLSITAAVISPDVTLTDLLEEMKSLQDTVSELTSNLTSANQLLEDYDDQVKSLQSTVGNLRQELSFTKVYDARALAHIGNIDPIISFQVHMEHDPPAIKNMDILKFSNVRDNRGECYNVTSGIFTAPVTGSYLFWCNIVNHHPLNYLAIYLYRDTRAIGYAEAPPYVYHGTASMTVATFLREGQEIFFRKFKGSENLLGAGWSSYGGTLIRSS